MVAVATAGRQSFDELKVLLEERAATGANPPAAAWEPLRMGVALIDSTFAAVRVRL